MRLQAIAISFTSIAACAVACGTAAGVATTDESPTAPSEEAAATASEAKATDAGANSTTATSGSTSRDAAASAEAGSVTKPASCTGKTGATGDRTVTITSGGRPRTFDLHVPASYDPSKATPLAFVFHGYTMTASSIAAASEFAKSADTRGMIVAFPTGIDGSFNAGDCCGSAYLSDVDDVAFTSDMIASIAGDYCVDDKRVFASGFSNGGYLAYMLGCDLADRIAAIASVSGVMHVTSASCNPKRPIPLLHVHGTADLYVPYAGTALTQSAAQSVETFRTKNSCAAGNGKVVYKKGDVSCRAWSSCAAGADVELCTVDGGGHQWPGGTQLPFGGVPSTDLKASDAIADFFLAHPLP